MGDKGNGVVLNPEKSNPSVLLEAESTGVKGQVSAR